MTGQEPENDFDARIFLFNYLWSQNLSLWIGRRQQILEAKSNKIMFTTERKNSATAAEGGGGRGGRGGGRASAKTRSGWSKMESSRLKDTLKWRSFLQLPSFTFFFFSSPTLPPPPPLFSLSLTRPIFSLPYSLVFFSSVLIFFFPPAISFFPPVPLFVSPSLRLHLSIFTSSSFRPCPCPCPWRPSSCSWRTPRAPAIHHM